MPVNYDQIVANLKRELRPHLEQIVSEAEQAARSYCPVDTGALQATIRSSITEDGNAFHVALEAGGDPLIEARGKDYSQYVEYGTTNPNYPIQPFIRPAGYEMSEKIRELGK